MPIVYSNLGYSGCAATFSDLIPHGTRTSVITYGMRNNRVLDRGLKLKERGIQDPGFEGEELPAGANISKLNGMQAKTAPFSRFGFNTWTRP